MIKVNDYGKLLGQVVQDNTKAIEDVKAAAEQIAGTKAQKYKENSDFQQRAHDNELKRVTDRFDSQLKKNTEQEQQRLKLANEQNQRELDKLKKEFLAGQQQDRNDFQNRINEASNSYRWDLEGKDEANRIRLDNAKDNYNDIRSRDEARHQQEVDGVKSATQKTVRDSETLASRQQMNEREGFQEQIAGTAKATKYVQDRDRANMAEELRINQKVSGERQAMTEADNRAARARQNDEFNRKLEDIAADREREVSAIESQYTEDRREILDQAREIYGRNIEEIKQAYDERLFNGDAQFREAIQLKEVENQVMKEKFEEKQMAMQKQFADQLNKEVKFNDQKMELERNNMRKEAYQRDQDYKNNLNLMRNQFNKEITAMQQKGRNEMMQVTDRYETQIATMKEENSRQMEKINQDHKREVEHLTLNSKMEKDDLIAYYDDRLKSSKTDQSNAAVQAVRRPAPKAADQA